MFVKLPVFHLNGVQRPGLSAPNSSGQVVLIPDSYRGRVIRSRFSEVFPARTEHMQHSILVFNFGTFGRVSAR